MSYSPGADCSNVLRILSPFSQMVHSAPSIFNSSIKISAFSSLSSAHRNRIPFRIFSSNSSFSTCGSKETDRFSATFRFIITSKQLPCPGSLSTSIVPPIDSIRFLVIAIPRPVPCILFVREPSARVNASKIVSLKSADIPIPLSQTKKRYFA